MLLIFVTKYKSPDTCYERIVTLYTSRNWLFKKKMRPFMCTAALILSGFLIKLNIFKGFQVLESLRMSPLAVLKTDTFKILSDLKVTENILC